MWAARVQGAPFVFAREWATGLPMGTEIVALEILAFVAVVGVIALVGQATLQRCSGCQ